MNAIGVSIDKTGLIRTVIVQLCRPDCKITRVRCYRGSNGNINRFLFVFRVRFKNDLAGIIHSAQFKAAIRGR